MGVLGYSVTPGSNNNALAGVGSLAENVMPIKQINDAMRQQVADIAQLYGDAVAGIYTTGTSAAYLVATASGHTVYNNTMALRLRFHVDSVAGAVTINVNGLGLKSLKMFATTGSRDPVVGEIKADMIYDCAFITALNCMIVMGPVVDLTTRQPLDADLTAIAALVGVEGDIIYRDATQWQRLAKGGANDLLRQKGDLTSPEWVNSNTHIALSLNASGAAPMYACRAWVNFNGTGVVAIRSAGNVSSITDNGVGVYNLNFAQAMPNATYAFAGSTDIGNIVLTQNPGSVKSVSVLQVSTITTNTLVGQDVATIHVAVFC